jgi:hypothetical protein
VMAMGAKKAIREPKNLRLPDDVWAVLEHFKPGEVEANLTGQRARDFQTEMLEALRESIANNDLRPLQKSLESWYRTVVVLKDPSFGAKLDWALKNPPDPKVRRDLKELKREIGL